MVVSEVEEGEGKDILTTADSERDESQGSLNWGKALVILIAG